MKTVRILVAIILIGMMFFLSDSLLPADTNDVFQQTDWVGGTSSLNAEHPDNKTNWNKFAGKDAYLNVNTAGRVSQSVQVLSVTDTSDSDFLSGTRTNLDITGSGTAATLGLQSANDDPFLNNPGQWTTLPEVPALVQWSAFARAGNYIYALWRMQTFARFNMTTESWEFLADMPMPTGHGAALAYAGGDFIYATRGGGTAFFYQYSISANTWTRLYDVPYGVAYGGTLASDNADRVYCLAGGGTNKFYLYTISTHSWSTAPVATRTVNRGASLVYPGTGTDLFAIFDTGSTTFSRYSMAGEAWVSLTAAPTIVGDLCYPGTGNYLYAWYEETWGNYFARYNFSTFTWEDLSATSNFPMYQYKGIMYDPGVGARLKWLSTGNYAKPLSFDPVTRKWDGLIGVKSNSVSSFGRMVYDGTNYIYHTTGSDSSGFARYSISDNLWISRTNMPFGAYNGHSLTYLAGKVYTMRGYGDTRFAVYDPGTNAWTERAPTPASTGYGASAATDGTNIYCLRGANTTTLWKYEPGINTWTQKRDTIASINGSALVYPYASNSGDFMFTPRGENTKTFYKYQISTDNWTQVTDAPYIFSANDKNTLTYPGSGNYIYAFFGNGANHGFARYDFINNVWQTLPSTPLWQNNVFTAQAVGDKIYAVNASDMLSYTISTNSWDEFPRNYDVPGFTYGSAINPETEPDSVYLFYGNSSSVFWKYSLAQKKWTALLKAPFLFMVGTKAAYPGSGNFIYVTQGGLRKAFWRYDFVNNTWAQRQDAPVDIFSGCKMTGKGDILYVIPGRDPSNPSSQASTLFYKYIISTDTWSIPLAPLPYPIYWSTELGNSFIHIPSQGKVYFRPGNGTGNFYAYNTGANAWATLTPSVVGGYSGQTLVYPGSGDFIYNAVPAVAPARFDKYSISTNAWTRLATPSRGWGYTAGDADMIYPGTGDSLYYFDGTVGYFTRYSLSRNDWDQPPTFPTSTDMQYYSVFERGIDGDTFYAGGYNVFYRYNISTRLWTTVRPPNADLGWNWDEWAPQLLYPGFGDYLYTTQGRNRATFARYSVSQNKWFSLAPTSFSFGSGHKLAATTSKIYALRGGSSKNFWIYNIVTDQWDYSGADLPMTVNYGSSLCYPGTGDFIYATRGDGSTDFYKYSITNNIWTAVASAPLLLFATDPNGASLMYPGRGDYLYFAAGSTWSYSSAFAGFYRYSILRNTWEEISSAPAGLAGSFMKVVYPGKGDYLYVPRGGYGNYWDILQYRLYTQGEYTSPIKNIGLNQMYDVVNWTDNGKGLLEFKARTSNNSQLNDALAWDNVPVRQKSNNLSDSYPAVKPTDQYLQYQMSFITDDIAQLPTLNDLIINYDKYPRQQELVSSAFNSSEARNRLMKLTWNNSLPSGTSARFLLRTAPDNSGQPGTWSSWLGPGGTQTINNTFGTDADYAHDPRVEVVNDVARLTKQLQDYTYTQRITLDNSDGVSSFSNAVMSIEIPADNNHFWSHVKADGADVRFVDGSGNLLSYNSNTKGASFNSTARYALIFVRIPSVPAGQKTTIYLKYGNAAAVSASDTALSLYIPFGSASVIDATTFDYSPQVVLESADKIVRFTGLTDGWGTKYLSYRPTYKREESKSFFFRFMQEGSTNSMVGWRLNNVNYSYSQMMHAIYFNGTTGYIYESGANVATIGAFVLNTWYDGKIVLKPAGGATYYWRQTGTASWTLLYDSTNRTETDLRPSLDHNTVMPFAYTRDWIVGDQNYMYPTSISGTGALVNSYFSTVEDNTSSSSLSGWSTRNAIDIDNTSGGDLEDYQVRVTMGSEYEGFWSACRSDGADVRFVDSDNTTILDYYITSFNYANKTASFWVKVPRIPGGAVKSVYLYYGRSDAAASSDMANTMTKDFREKGVDNVSGLSVDGSAAHAVVSSSSALDITQYVTVEANVKYDIDYWPPGWALRQKITLDNAGGREQKDVVAQFDVPLAAGMQANYADIRFWEVDHSQKLRYRTLSFDGAKATVYVVVPYVPANSTKDIYVYYSNAGAVSESDDTVTVFSNTGLTGYWKFDEANGDTITDSSGSNNNGTRSAGITARSAGKSGTALDLNGTTYFGVTASASLQNARTTIAFWVKKNDALLDGILNRFNGQSSSWENSILFLANANVRVRFYQNGNNYNLDGGTTVIGQWHHVAVTFGTSSQKLYLDGNLVASSAVTGTLATNTAQMIIGGQGFDGSRYNHRGLLDELVIYNRELSSSEIKDLARGVITFTPAFSLPQADPASGAWLPGFLYRKPVVVDNTGGGYVADKVYSWNIPFITGKMRADYTDIRFVDSDGKKLPYRIFTYDGTQANFLVKVPVVPPNSNKQIYMYYGNNQAVSGEDASLASALTFSYNTYTGWADNYGTPPRTYVSGNYKMMGGYNNYGVGNYAQYIIPALSAGTYNISFNYYMIDTWDAEYAQVYANGVLVWSKYRDVLRAEAVSLGDINGAGWTDYKWSGTIPVTHSGGALTLKFTSTLDSAASDESFGLDNVVIPGSSPVAVTLGTEVPAPSGIDQSVAVKAGAYGLKFTDAGLTAILNGTSVSTVNYDSGKAMHAAMTYDGAILKLFVNGSQKASTVLTGSISTNTNALTVGQGIKGMVDEVRIWNIPRLAGSINEDQLKYLDGTETGLRSYLRFNNATGSIAVDSSIYGNGATLLNGAGWALTPFGYDNSKARAIYHMDEGVGTTAFDASGYENTLTLSGVSWSNADLTGFPAGKMLNFNGTTAYASAPASSSLDVTGRISLEAWIKPLTTTGNHTVLAKGSDTYSRWNYELLQVADSIAFVFSNGVTKQNIVTPACLLANTLYYIAATFDMDTDTVKIYVNGVLKYTSTLEYSAMLINSDPLYIGREASGANAFSGSIDEVRIYNYVLTQDQVTAHYEQRLLAKANPIIYNAYSPTVNAAVGAYAVNNPVIQPYRGFYYSSKNMMQFQEIANKPYGTEIKYQVSPNAYVWYWWDGSQWSVVSGGYLQANIATEINTHFAALQDLYPDGIFYYRAYLHSEPFSFNTPSLDNIGVTLVTGDTYYLLKNGSTPINPVHSDGDNDQWFQYKAIFYSDGMDTGILDDVSVDYINSFINVVSPNGGEVLAVGSVVPVTWTSQAITSNSGTGLVKLEYSLDGGNTYQSISNHVANTGTYNWTVPDSPAQEAKIRITSEDLPAVTDISNAAFKILSVNLTSPNGAEAWEAGKTHAITWAVTGVVPNNIVKIEYSSNDGATWNVISAVAPNNGTFSWLVPSVFSDSMRIRISSPTNAQIMDVSNAVFSILRVPAFSIISPTADDQFSIGATAEISWRTNSLLFSADCLLEYSTDDFQSDIHPIATVPVGTPQGAGKNDNIIGSYSWIIPDVLSSSVKVRVSEDSIPAGRDTQQAISINSAAFTIIEPQINITSPVVADVWVAGDTNSITWASDGIVSDDLTLEYSLDDADFILIADHQANTGSFSWEAPIEAAGDSVYIRITDSERPQITGVSPAFRILSHATIEIIQPDGGETLTMGTNYDIQWRSYGNKLGSDGADYNKISIYYSTDNGSTWTLAVFDRANIGAYSWRVPDVPTTQALIKIVDQNDPLAADLSAAAFSIVLPSITLTAPNGGESWYATGSYQITWTSVGSISNNLKLEYSTNSGSTWSIIRTGQANTGAYTWGPIADVNSTHVRLRITDMTYPTVMSTSLEDFTITPPILSVSTPNGGEVYAVGTTQNIRWTTLGENNGAVRDNLTIQFSSNGGATWANVATGEINDGLYEWSVPDNISTACLLKVFDATRAATMDTTDAVFVVALPSITITSPDGGEEWPIGTQKNITWTSLGTVSNNLTIEYSKDNFQTVTTIASNVNNIESYTWTVPDDLSAVVKIRIRDAMRPQIVDTSSNTFSIVNPILTVLYPNGGELVSVGDVENITWQSVGAVTNSLKIEYSRDSFATATQIAANAPNTGTFVWTVPDDVSATLKVKITDNARSLVWDKSDANFTILPTPAITIMAPASGDTWRIGTIHNITWTDNGGRISNNLTLQYSIDGGSTWLGIATGEANDGTYAWTIPDNMSATAKVRIFDAGRPATADNSEIFDLANPKITLVAPNGGEIWSVGDSGPVRWTTEGAVSNNLVMEYSPDGGVTWYLVRGGIPNSGDFSWTIPDYVSALVLLRIKDGNRPAVVDISDAVFTINPMPTITFTAPVGGQEFVLGETVNITWQWTGLSIANMTLDYSNDNFSTRRVIATNLSNTGSYSWTIPSDALIGQTIQLRLTDGVRTQITAKSSGYLRIRGGFVISSPNGAEQWVAKSTQTITWQTLGTIPSVKLEYTLDGNNWVFIGSPTNIGSYSWILPDARSSTVKLRISDPDDATTFDVSDADSSIVYATVVFKVLDYDSLQHLSDFAVSEPATGWSDSGLSSPETRTAMYPYGAYTTFFTKLTYIDGSASWNPPKQGISPYYVTVYLENSANAQVSWDAILTYGFSPANDSLSAVGSLQRKGKLIGTTDNERADLGAATLTIYETDGRTVKNALVAATPGSTGMYNFTLTNTGFEGGKVYPAVLSIEYRDHPYVSSANIDVGSEILQYQFFTQTATQLAQSVSNIERTVALTAEEIKTEVKTAIADTRTEIKIDTKKILTATETSIPAKIEEARALVDTIKTSEILNTDNTIKEGDTLVIRYRTFPGVHPVIDVYNAANVHEVVSAAMIEVGSTGIYEYSVKFYQSYGKGDFTIVCSESTKGTLDAMTITVHTTDMEQVYNQISSVVGATAGLPNMTTTIANLGTQFTAIENVFSQTSQDIVSGVKDALGSSTTMGTLFTQLTGVAKQVRALGGDKGVNLESLYAVSENRQQDMTYLKNKTQELKATMEINKKLIENIANKPVVQTWYEYK